MGFAYPKTARRAQLLGHRRTSHTTDVVGRSYEAKTRQRDRYEGIDRYLRSGAIDAYDFVLIVYRTRASEQEIWYVRPQKSNRDRSTTRQGSTPPAGRRRFHSRPPRRRQLEALRGVSTFGPTSRHRRSSLAARTLHDQGPGAPRREIDVTPAP